MCRMSSPVRVKVWILSSLIIVGATIAYLSRSYSLESEVKRFSASVENANEDEHMTAEDAFTRKLVANSSYSNSELIAVALKDTTSVSAQSAIFMALDERGFKFTTTAIEDYMIFNPVSQVRGRLVYVRFLRDGNLSAIELFVKRVLSLERTNTDTKAITREKGVCWSLALKKYPEVSSLESDPKIGPIIRSFRKVTDPKETQR